MTTIEVVKPIETLRVTQGQCFMCWRQGALILTHNGISERFGYCRKCLLTMRKMFSDAVRYPELREEC